MPKKWKLTKTKQLVNDFSIIQMCVEARPEFDFDWVVLGVFMLPDFLFDNLLKEGSIQREILITDEVPDAE